MMNIKIVLYILLTTFIVACGSSKLAKQEAAQMESAPAWVNERPVNSAYYIGIAKVLKASYPNNYQEIAKKKALNDMASEISVNIQSNSIVSSYEDKAGFQSEFSNYIQMEMSKDLSGYQMQGSFESTEKYMVYYRLSKNRWKQIQAERKKAAADKAYTLYVQAKKEEKELNTLKKKHEKLRNILIDYGNEEFGDCIIDEISELFDTEPTTVYYEE